MTSTGSLPSPILNARPHEDVVPHCYVVVRHEQLCVCCGHKTRWSELYAQTFYRSQHGMAKSPVQNLRRLDWPKYNLPIVCTKGRTEKLPFCHHCFETRHLGCGAPTVAHLPEVLEPPSIDRNQVCGTGGPSSPKTNVTPLKATAAAKGPKAKPTTDSLLDFI